MQDHREVGPVLGVVSELVAEVPGAEAVLLRVGVVKDRVVRVYARLAAQPFLMNGVCLAELSDARSVML